MKLTNICKTYKTKGGVEVPAVKNVNINFNKAGMVFILGKSGCGKSSLLNMLGLLDRPTSGEFELYGKNITDLTTAQLYQIRREKIGFIFQDFNLNPDLSVKENILFSLEILDMFEDAESKLDEVLNKLNILEIKNKRVNELSGGQQQRVAIARALIKNPEILLADEPTGNLDEQTAKVVFNMLKKESKNKLVVIVTHDRDFANKYGDRIIEIAEGKVKCDKTIKQTKNFVASKINSSEKAELKFKTINKLTRANLKSKALKLSVITLLMTIAMSVMGSASMFGLYTFGAMAGDFMYENTNEVLTVFSGHYDEDKDQFAQSECVFNNDNLNVLKNYSNNVDVVYENFGYKISNSEDLYENSKVNIHKFISSTEKGLSKYNFELLWGVYPEAHSQIAITDFMAYNLFKVLPDQSVSIFNVSTEEELSILLSNIESIQTFLNGASPEKLTTVFGENYLELVNNGSAAQMIFNNPGIMFTGEELKFNNKTVLITGVIQTTDYLKYVKFFNVSNEEMILTQDTKTIAQFNHNLTHVYFSLYVTQDFFENAYDIYLKINDDVRVISQTNADSYLKNAEQLDLSYNDVYATTNMFKALFGDVYVTGTTNTYTVENTITKNIHYSSIDQVFVENQDLNVIGTYDNKKNVNDTSRFLIVNDQMFADMSINTFVPDSVKMEVPTNKSKYSSLLNTLYDNYMYTNSAYTDSFFEIDDILILFQDIFSVGAIVMFVFSAMLFASFIVESVIAKSKNIGIMQALGLQNRKIILVHVIEALIVSAIIILCSAVMIYFVNNMFNSYLIAEIAKINDLTFIDGLTILPFSIYPYLYIVLSCLIISMVSIFISIYRLQKIEPIKVIRQNF